MREAKAISAGLVLAVWAAAPARAECLGDCGYGGLIAIVLLAGLAVLALVIFVMIKLGIGWLIKWIVGATVLAVAIPPAILGYRHAHKQWLFEKLDHVGIVPRLADRTPLVILGGDLRNCPDPLERYVRAWAKEGVLAVTMWKVEGVDFARPVRIADLPLERHVGGQSAGDDPDYDGPYKGYSYHVRKLSAEDRARAAAEIDYVVIAQCSQSHELFDVFATLPALQSDAERFYVELAFAPVEKGSGLLSVRDLKFDLLDLRYLGVTRGFLFANSRVGGQNSVPYDPAMLEAALCPKADGTTMPDCRK